MPDAGTIILIGAVFMLAGLLQGLCGFGFSLLSVSVLAILIDHKLAVALAAVAGSANSFYLAWLLRRSIMVRSSLVPIVIALVFVPVGVWFLRCVDRSIVVRALGVLVLVVSAIGLVRAQKLRVFASRPCKWVAGAASGIFGGAFNAPGPPLVLYAHNCDWPTRNAIANLQFMFSVIAVGTLSAFWCADVLNARRILWGLAYMPAVMVFSLLGSRLSQKLPVRHLTVLINVVLLCLGVMLAIKG